MNGRAIRLDAQAELFEPTPAECSALWLAQVAKSETLTKQASIARTRGAERIARDLEGRAHAHAAEADDLAMLAEFYSLGGVRA